jgi:hypothetical protein
VFGEKLMEEKDLDQEISKEAILEFNEKKDQIVKKVVERIITLDNIPQEEIQKYKIKITAGILFVFEQLTPAMMFSDQALLEDQMDWAMVRLPYDGIDKEQVSRNFRIMIEVMLELMSEENAEQVSNYLKWMIARIENNS